jgi:hypothetical protein
MSGDTERMVLVPRRGKTPEQAFEIARGKLVAEGFTPLQLKGYSIERDKMTNSETFLLRVEIESGGPA